MLQSDSTQIIDHIQKCFRQKLSVREGRHTGPLCFFIGGGAEATSKSTPLFYMEPSMFFYDVITDFKTNSVTYNIRSF